MPRPPGPSTFGRSDTRCGAGTDDAKITGLTVDHGEPSHGSRSSMVKSRNVETVVRRVVPEESSDLQGEVAGQPENRHALHQVQHRRDDMEPPELLHVHGMSCRGRRSVPTRQLRRTSPPRQR